MSRPSGAGSFGAGAEFQTGGFQGAGFKDARFPQDDPLGCAPSGPGHGGLDARAGDGAARAARPHPRHGDRAAGQPARIGLDAIVGLIPVIGDVVTTAISSYIVWEARRLGAPRWLIARMAANVAIDGVVGALPLVGDLFDAGLQGQPPQRRAAAPSPRAQRVAQADA